ncbi:hypothetical protein [Vibrio sp. TBV020]|uniref:hypothetical protein n=1 Tax=Vibrio sp. TBV020 TaxID=3137398 RepID=UPI0038CD4182
MSFTLIFASVTASAQTNPLSYSTDNAHLELSLTVHPAECPKSDHSDQTISHHCCASICLLKTPLAQTVTLTTPLSVSLAPIGQDTFGKAISRIQTLFRPPIA